MAEILPRKIFRFFSPRLKSDLPHYFICLSNNDPDSTFGFVCCTTQFDKRKRAIELSGYPASTLVTIERSTYNKLPLESYVDCNSYLQFEPSEIAQKIRYESFEYTGELEEKYFASLLDGINLSPKHERRIRLFYESILEKLLGG